MPNGVGDDAIRTSTDVGDFILGFKLCCCCPGALAIAPHLFVTAISPHPRLCLLLPLFTINIQLCSLRKAIVVRISHFAFRILHLHLHLHSTFYLLPSTAPSCLQLC